MPLLIRLPDIKEDGLRLTGELSAAELQLEGLDELLTATEPLSYDLEASLMDGALLVQGGWAIRLCFHCARCLRPFEREIGEPNWACHMPVSGEGAVPVVDETVDLTSQVREDIVLALPQHPGCGDECAGLPKTGALTVNSGGSGVGLTATDWSELDKLKL
jgi:uncharacterized metal-binding protein YceD (DUF177 family)